MIQQIKHIEKDNILYEVENCINSNIKIIGLGIRIYPINIQKLFPFIVYSPNPEEVIYAIISFFGDNSLKLENKIPEIEQSSSIKLNLDIDNFKSNYICIFKKLKKKLKKTIKEQIDLSNLFNPEINLKEMEQLNNYIPILKKDALKGQKILIVMLWSYEMYEDENKAIHSKYIKIQNIKKNNCIKTATDYFGIEIEVVDDYETVLNN